jgi:hypothetical protein
MNGLKQIKEMIQELASIIDHITRWKFIGFWNKEKKRQCQELVSQQEKFDSIM